MYMQWLKGVKNFSNYTGKHFYQSIIFTKFAGLLLATLSKQRLRHRCFPANCVKFLPITFLQYTAGRLLLKDIAKLLVALKSNYDWRRKIIEGWHLLNVTRINMRLLTNLTVHFDESFFPTQKWFYTIV